MYCSTSSQRIYLPDPDYCENIKLMQLQCNCIVINMTQSKMVRIWVPNSLIFIILHAMLFSASIIKILTFSFWNILQMRQFYMPAHVHKNCGAVQKGCFQITKAIICIYNNGNILSKAIMQCQEERVSFE